MMLSNRITANKREAKPAIQHISSTEKIISDEIPPTFLALKLFARFDVSLMMFLIQIAGR